MATPIRIKRSAVPGKRPQVTDLQVGELALNTYDAELVTLRDRFAQTGIATEVVRLGAGATVTNVIYVTKDGNDNNTGLKLGDAKGTIAGAVAISTTGSIIRVSAGSYIENNPVILPSQVSIVGDSLREVSVTPQNAGEDLFYVAPGNYLSELSFTGSMDSGKAIVAFNPNKRRYSAQSPYISNCTNFIQNSIGLKVDGDHVIGPFKSMVTDSYTQYNSNGIGVSITNNGYAQLVSIFTINPDVSIFAGSGGQCDLTNSNSSFGNFGLVADGVGDTQFTGTVNTATVAEGDTFTLNNVKDDLNNVRKPFDGQAFFFKLDLDDYADTALGKTGITTAPLNLVRSIKITDGGSGYSQSAPPNVTITAPAGPEAILAELSANVSAAGTITSVDVIASGRNFLPTGVGANQQDVTISFSSGSATAVAEMDPIFFTVETATEPTNAGLTTVTFNEFVPYAVSAGSSSEFKRISRIITSSHSFEYIGAGTDINSSNPFQGGEPIPENEIVAINGGQVPFTSTDQKGNFRIGQGLTVDQTTSTIRGRDFNRAIQAQLTPLILALR